LAKVKNPDLAKIDRLGPDIDFYYWKGIPVVRKMPKKFKPIGTEAQKATWAAMKYAHDEYQKLPTFEREAYKVLTAKSQMCNRDFVTKLCLKNFPEFGEKYASWRVAFNPIPGGVTDVTVRLASPALDTVALMTYNETRECLKWLEISPNLRGKKFRRRWDLKEDLSKAHKLDDKFTEYDPNKEGDYMYTFQAEKGNGDEFLVIQESLPDVFSVFGGQGENTLAYSLNGQQIKGLGNDIFDLKCMKVAFGKGLIVAVGAFENTIAYSGDLKNWHGLGADIIDYVGYAVCFGNDIFVAGGYRGNTLAWSEDGKAWNGLGSDCFDLICTSLFWYGDKFLGTGKIDNTLAWSSNGIDWNGLGNSIFTNAGWDVFCRDGLCLAGGSGGNTLAWSLNGIAWNGLGNSIFGSYCYAVHKFRDVWVAGGNIIGGAGNTLAWSSNGIDWNGLGDSIFSSFCYDFFDDGEKIWALGKGGNSIAWSVDGKIWNGLGNAVFDVAGWCGGFSGGCKISVDGSLGKGSYLSGLYNIPYI